MAVDAALAKRLIDNLTSDLSREGRMGKPRRYLAGDQDLAYMPKGARREYEHLARRSITNWLPLVSDTFAKGLFVDGYRPARVADNAGPWAYWQANGLDARQTVAHRGALEYGVSYALVLPGDRAPLMRPLPATKTLAWYADDDDEWPEVGLIQRGTLDEKTRLYDVLDAEAVYRFGIEEGKDPVLLSTDAHPLGVTPLVRFRDRLDGEATGIIRPLFTLQDRVNEVVFSTLIAMQYASFRQRWATGLAIPLDDDGNPVEPFSAAVDRLWVTDDPDARFGDFAQTELSGHHAAYTSTVRTLAAVAQVSPSTFTGDLVNLSAEALAQMEATTQRKISEYETIFGESWEQAFRLAALAAGDRAAAADTSAQVRWRDTEARSLAQTVDALGKISQMLSVPPEVLWEKIPGITDQDVEAWRAAAQEGDALSRLADTLAAQAAPAVAVDEPPAA